MLESMHPAMARMAAFCSVCAAASASEYWAMAYSRLSGVQEPVMMSWKCVNSTLRQACACPAGNARPQGAEALGAQQRGFAAAG